MRDRYIIESILLKQKNKVKHKKRKGMLQNNRKIV